MITIEQLRERLKTPARASAKVEWTKWIGSPTSWLALFLSAVTAYFTLIRQSDDIRVAIAEWPELYVEVVKEIPHLGIYRPQQHLTLINSGNRAAMITRIDLVVGRPQVGELQCPRKSTRLEYVFNGLAIKPGEIVPISLERLKRDYRFVQLNNQGDTTVIFDNPPSLDMYVVACLSFLVITPDNVSQDVTIPIYATTLRYLGETMLMPKPALFKRDTPTILISRRRTIFWE
jgi:hypothetical protein